MAHDIDAHERETLFIDRMLAELRADEAKGMSPPIERRKLRTITHECGQKRAGRPFLKRLQDASARMGLYSEPHLTDDNLRPDDWIHFSTGPFPPDAMMFSREEDLRAFVEACLGNGVFRNLELYREAGNVTGHEYTLPNRMRIDILCHERAKGGLDGLVAIELKRDVENGVVEQMVKYLQALQRRFPGRRVRGIIISGREDRVGAALLKKTDDFQIDWYCYKADFEKVS